MLEPSNITPSDLGEELAAIIPGKDPELSDPIKIVINGRPTHEAILVSPDFPGSKRLTASSTPEGDLFEIDATDLKRLLMVRLQHC